MVQEFLHSHIRAEDTEFYLSPDALQVQQILSLLSPFFFTMCVVGWTVWLGIYHLPHIRISTHNQDSSGCVIWFGDVAGGRGGGNTRVSQDVGDPRHAGTDILMYSSYIFVSWICPPPVHLASPVRWNLLPFSAADDVRQEEEASVWTLTIHGQYRAKCLIRYVCICRCRCPIWLTFPTCPTWLTCPTSPACLWDSPAADPPKVLPHTAMHRAILNLGLEKDADCASLV